MCRGQAGLHVLLAFLLGVGVTAPSSAHAAPAQAPASQPSGAAPPEETPPAPVPPDLDELAETPLQPESPILLLASVPNMFGDFFQAGTQFRFAPTNPPYTVSADLPAVGGMCRVKIAENNKALPTDRVYFAYNHYQNALQAIPDLTSPTAVREYSVDRYIVGIEKTLLNGCWSVDVRMPFIGSYSASLSGLDVEGGSIGNLGVIVKRRLWTTDRTAVAAGLGIETPTGDDVTAEFGGMTRIIRNDAVHLSPFVGFLAAPNGRLFSHGFLQVDVAANGNRVDYSGSGGSGTYGILNDQTLLYLDYAVGYWLYRNPCASLVSGLAPVVEFHYTTTLQDADVVTSSYVSAFEVGNLLNRVDIVNFTVGLHAELGRCTNLRVGGVFPLNDRPKRPFDAEVQVSLNRRF